MELILPDLSEGNEGATITLWHAKENEAVTKDQDILEVVTDKATFDVPSPCDGILKKIMKAEGEEIKAGEIIAIIDDRR